MCFKKHYPCSLQWCNSLRPNLTMAIETKCWCENNAVNENIDHKAWEHHLEMMAEQCTMYELIWKILNSLGKDAVDLMRSLQHSGTKGTIIFWQLIATTQKILWNIYALEQKSNVFLLSKFCQNKGSSDKICLKFLWKTVVLVDILLVCLMS